MEGSLKENGGEIIWKAWVSISGMMGESIKEIIKMIRRMGMEYISGLMEENIWDIGVEVNSMAWESILFLMKIR